MELAVAVRIASEFTGRVQLPVFPYLLERLLQARHEPLVGLPALAGLIRMDPALCFHAMRLDRSTGPHGHGPHSLSTEAVIDRIGMAGIDAITAQAMADHAFNGIHYRQGLALDWLWRHCLATAIMAQGLAMALDYHHEEEAYIAGLLHNIGKLTLLARTPAACLPMLSDPSQAATLIEAETMAAGSGHEQIGAWLIRRYTGAWFAADAAMFQTADAVDMKNALPLVRIIWAANRLVDTPHASSEACQTVAAIFNLAPRQLVNLSRKTSEQVVAAGEELGVMPQIPDINRDTDGGPTPYHQAIKTGSMLSSVYSQLQRSDDRNAILRVLRQSLSVFLGIDTLILLNHEPQSYRLTGAYAAGNPSGPPIYQLHIPLSATECLPVVCHVSGELADSFSTAPQNKLTIIDRQIMAYMDTDGMVCIPLRSDSGHLRSCLILGINGGDWPWVKTQKTVLHAIVTAVSGALLKVHREHDRINTQIADGIASTLSKTRKIVHEINNPLSIIKNYLTVLARHTDEDTLGQDELRIIDEEINRVAGLIKSLTSPSGSIPVKLETVDVNATIMDILELFREGLSEKTAIRLSQDLDAHIPAITADRDRLKQALINLLKNAIEAMPEGGTISVRTSMQKHPPRQNGSKDEADYIQISICDNGPGIDEGIKNELFKPEVTSKPGHDGLGLSVVHEAVTHLKGSLHCESTTGQGTCFHIELPTGDNES